MNSDELLVFGMHNYDNPTCKTLEEFEEDYQKFAMVARMLKKEEVNVKLVLNYIITLYNVFRFEAATQILFIKVDKEYWGKLKAFVQYLNFMPDTIEVLSITSSNIPLDQKIDDELRQI